MLVLLVVLIIQFPLSSVIFRARLAIGEATDRRLNLVNKLIHGIQTIKCYVWEQPILEKTHHARKVECRRLVTLYFWKGWSEGISRNTSALLGLPIMLLPLAQGRPLVASVIFTALTLTDSISFNCVKNFSYGISAAADYFSVIKRIEEVLLL